MLFLSTLSVACAAVEAMSHRDSVFKSANAAKMRIDIPSIGLYRFLELSAFSAGSRADHFRLRLLAEA